MAEGLSAVAVTASPRAVAKASWSGIAKPLAAAFNAGIPAIIMASSFAIRGISLIECILCESTWDNATHGRRFGARKSTALVETRDGIALFEKRIASNIFQAWNS